MKKKQKKKTFAFKNKGDTCWKPLFSNVTGFTGGVHRSHSQIPMAMVAGYAECLTQSWSQMMQNTGAQGQLAQKKLDASSALKSNEDVKRTPSYLATFSL